MYRIDSGRKRRKKKKDADDIDVDVLLAQVNATIARGAGQIAMVSRRSRRGRGGQPSGASDRALVQFRPSARPDDEAAERSQAECAQGDEAAGYFQPGYGSVDGLHGMYPSDDDMSAGAYGIVGEDAALAVGATGAGSAPRTDEDPDEFDSLAMLIPPRSRVRCAMCALMTNTSNHITDAVAHGITGTIEHHALTDVKTIYNAIVDFMFAFLCPEKTTADVEERTRWAIDKCGLTQAVVTSCICEHVSSKAVRFAAAFKALNDRANMYRQRQFTRTKDDITVLDTRVAAALIRVHKTIDDMRLLMLKRSADGRMAAAPRPPVLMPSITRALRAQRASMMRNAGLSILNTKSLMAEDAHAVAR